MSLKILHAEDQSDIRFLTKELLPEFGDFQITFVSNGSEAIRAVMRDSFDLIITDLMMPYGKGIDSIKTQKEPGGIIFIRSVRETNKQIPIVVLSAWETAKYRNMAKIAGADDFVAKPFDTEQLAKRITRVYNEKKGSTIKLQPDSNILKEWKNSVRRLAILRDRESKAPDTIDPSVIMEIEDLEIKINQLQEQLNEQS